MSTDEGRPARRFDVDWLRVLAVLLVICYHCSVVFDTTEPDFYVANDESSLGLQLLNYVLSQWRLPLLFLVSGIGTAFALRRRSAGAYARERLSRLGVPLVAGVLLVVPPQVWLWRRSDSGFDGGYFEFYPSFFDGIRPEGNFEWAHLWFLAYLLVYSLVAMPLLWWWRSTRANRARRWLAARIDGPGRLLLLSIPLIASEVALRPAWPGFQNLVDDWANLVFYFLLFCYGYVLTLTPTFLQAVNRSWRSAAVVAAVITTALTVAVATGHEPTLAYTLPSTGFLAAETLNIWLWLVTVLGAARAYLRSNPVFLRWATKAVLPVYVLHQTVVVVVAYGVVLLSAPPVVKFLAIFAISVALCVVLYEFVRRIPLLRTLIGAPAPQPARSSPTTARTDTSPTDRER